jgi:hypothetical protein
MTTFLEFFVAFLVPSAFRDSVAYRGSVAGVYSVNSYFSRVLSLMDNFSALSDESTALIFLKRTIPLSVHSFTTT